LSPEFSITAAPLAAFQNIREPQLDKSLPGYADSFRFSIDCAKQVHGEINIDSLNFAARAGCAGQIQMRREIYSSVMHFIQAGGTENLGKLNGVRDVGWANRWRSFTPYVKGHGPAGHPRA
jgi:hypothetical protein